MGPVSHFNKHIKLCTCAKFHDCIITCTIHQNFGVKRPYTLLQARLLVLTMTRVKVLTFGTNRSYSAKTLSISSSERASVEI